MAKEKRTIERDCMECGKMIEITVYEELSRLAQLGIIFFEEDGQNKRPVV